MTTAERPEYPGCSIPECEETSNVAIMAYQHRNDRCPGLLDDTYPLCPGHHRNCMDRSSGGQQEPVSNADWLRAQGVTLKSISGDGCVPNI